MPFFLITCILHHNIFFWLDLIWNSILIILLDWLWNSIMITFAYTLVASAADISLLYQRIRWNLWLILVMKEVKFNLFFYSFREFNSSFCWFFLLCNLEGSPRGGRGRGRGSRGRGRARGCLLLTKFLYFVPLTIKQWPSLALSDVCMA